MTTSPNNIKHISDAASSVDFNPSGTNFPTSINNVQSALSSMAPYCIESIGLPQTSISSPGVVQLATQNEMNAGTNDVKVPSVKVIYDFVKKPLATEAAPGTIEIATTAEAVTATAKDRAITPYSLSHVLDVRAATVSKSGTARIATTAQAQTGSDDNVIMTPLKVKQAIDRLVAPVATATESNKGIVQLATTAQIQAGTARDGFAISPYQFARAHGTQNSYGTFKAAVGNDIRLGTATDKAVTPKSLFENKGATDRYGIVALSTTVTPGHPNHALAANAAVLPTTGGDMTGTVRWTTNHGVRWEYNTDAAWITFLSEGDSDPNTRMEFGVSDNNTEYFRWVSNATSGGGAYEMMRLRPSGVRNKADLMVNGYIYDVGGNRVYSPSNKPTASGIGAMSNYWGTTQITEYVNNFDGVVDWECPYHCVMVGVYSIHSNHCEDRRFRYKYKRIG